MQEDTIRRLERERNAQHEKIEALEEAVGQFEGDRRQLKEKVMKLQQSEAKSEQEKEAMRVQIENAESRITKIELKKRSLEGILSLYSSMQTLLKHSVFCSVLVLTLLLFFLRRRFQTSNAIS